MPFPLQFTNPYGWLPLKSVSRCNKTLPIIVFTSLSSTFSEFPNQSNSDQLRFVAEKFRSESLRDLGKVHAFVLKTKTFPDPGIQPKLFSSSEAISYFCFILKLLDNPGLSVDLCNAVLRQNGDSRLSMVLVREMFFHGFEPDEYTVPFVFKGCARSRAFREGLQIQAYSVKTGLIISNVYVRNTVMRLYGVCGFVESVRRLFEESPLRDMVTWTTLIQCYAKMGLYKDAVEAFFHMCEAGVEADEMTAVVVLSACANLGDLALGVKIHNYIGENGLTLDVFVNNSLVDLYLKCGDAESARAIFDSMTVRNVVSWNSLISGLAHLGRFEEALAFFRDMQSQGIEPDDVTLVGVLNSCANLGLLELGKWVHKYTQRNRIEPDSFIGNALVDMYAKCGTIDRAFRVFEGMKRRDVYTYTSIIAGLGLHGEARRALEIFDEMIRDGIKPDEVTLVGVLTACSHAGLVAEGKKYFRDLECVYGLRPRTEHFGCLIDLLGRAGLIEEAEEVILNMPMEPDSDMWGALLGACKIHGRVELGEDVLRKLLKSGPEKDGAYVLMSNIYSSANKWKEAVKLRKRMKKDKVKKTPGCSSITLHCVVYEFRRGDKSNPRSREIYQLLREMARHLKE